MKSNHPKQPAQVQTILPPTRHLPEKTMADLRGKDEEGRSFQRQASFTSRPLPETLQARLIKAFEPDAFLEAQEVITQPAIPKTTPTDPEVVQRFIDFNSASGRYENAMGQAGIEKIENFEELLHVLIKAFPALQISTLRETLVDMDSQLSKWTLANVYDYFSSIKMDRVVPRGEHEQSSDILLPSKKGERFHFGFATRTRLRAGLEDDEIFSLETTNENGEHAEGNFEADLEKLIEEKQIDPTSKKGVITLNNSPCLDRCTPRILGSEISGDKKKLPGWIKKFGFSALDIYYANPYELTQLDESGVSNFQKTVDLFLRAGNINLIPFDPMEYLLDGEAESLASGQKENFEKMKVSRLKASSNTKSRKRSRSPSKEALSKKKRRKTKSTEKQEQDNPVEASELDIPQCDFAGITQQGSFNQFDLAYAQFGCTPMAVTAINWLLHQDTLTPNDIEAIILEGGETYVHMVNEAIENLSGLDIEVNAGYFNSQEVDIEELGLERQNGITVNGLEAAVGSLQVLLAQNEVGIAITAGGYTLAITRRNNFLTIFDSHTGTSVSFNAGQQQALLQHFRAVYGRVLEAYPSKGLYSVTEPLERPQKTPGKINKKDDKKKKKHKKSAKPMDKEMADQDGVDVFSIVPFIPKPH